MTNGYGNRQLSTLKPQAPSRKPQAPASPKPQAPSHSENVETRIHHQHFAGDAAPRVAEQKGRRIADFGGLDRAPQRRLLADHAEDRREAADTRGGKRLHRAG